MPQTSKRSRKIKTDRFIVKLKTKLMRKKRTSLRGWTGKLCQTVRIMKITLLLVFLSLAQLQASVSAQLVSVELKNASLQEIFEQVKRQTGVSFMFSNAILR